jgi:hypothetical protein
VIPNCGPRRINGVLQTCSYNSARLNLMDVFGFSVSITTDQKHTIATLNH